MSQPGLLGPEAQPLPAGDPTPWTVGVGQGPDTWVPKLSPHSGVLACWTAVGRAGPGHLASEAKPPMPGCCGWGRAWMPGS